MSTVYKYVSSGAATVSGYWAGQTENVLGDQCTQIYVKATTATTVFDFIMTDENGIEVQRFDDEVGITNDLTSFAARGIHTLEIENSTRDEAFTVMVCFLER